MAYFKLKQTAVQRVFGNVYRGLLGAYPIGSAPDNSVSLRVGEWTSITIANKGGTRTTYVNGNQVDKVVHLSIGQMPDGTDVHYKDTHIGRFNLNYGESTLTFHLKDMEGTTYVSDVMLRNEPTYYKHQTKVLDYLEHVPQYTEPWTRIWNLRGKP